MRLVVLASLFLSLPALAQGATDELVESTATDEVVAEVEAAQDEPAAEGGDVIDQCANPVLARRLGINCGADAAFPLHISASLTNMMGTGSFVAGAADNPFFATNLNLSPWASWGAFNFSGNMSLDMEWSQSDFTTYPNQLMLSDFVISGAYGGLRFKEANIGTNFSVSLDIPLALDSRWDGKLTGITTSASANWSYAPANLTLGARVGGKYNVLIPALARGGCNAPVKPFVDDAGNTITPSGCLNRDPSDPQNYAHGFTPRLFVLNGGVNANWGFAENLSLSGGITLIRAWSVYDAGPEDELTADPAAPGRGAGLPLVSANVGVNWTPTAWFALSGGMSHFDDGLSAGRDNVRVPFFDSLFLHPARNGTVFSVTTSFNY